MSVRQQSVPVKRGLVGRSDLLEVVARHPGFPAELLARLSGFSTAAEAVPVDTVPEKKVLGHAPDAEKPEPKRTAPIERSDSTTVSFLRAETATTRALEEQEPLDLSFMQAEPFSNAELAEQSRLRPEFGLQPWSRLWPRLHQRLGHMQTGCRIDVKRLVRQLAAQRPIRKMPRSTHLHWPKALLILFDGSAAMEPFHPEMRLLVRSLKERIGRHNVRVQTINDPVRQRCDVRGQGAMVLALSDFGFLEIKASVGEAWGVLGRRLAAEGCRLSALVPCSPKQWEAGVASQWMGHCWDQVAGGGGEVESAACVDALLTLLAPAVRVEPQLLRKLRLLLMAEGADARTEFAVWNHPAVIAERTVMVVDYEMAHPFRERFARLDEALKARAVQTILAAHAHCSPFTRAFEMLNLKAYGAPLSSTDEQWAHEVVARTNARLFHALKHEGPSRAGPFAEAARGEIVRLGVHGDRLQENSELTITWALCRRASSAETPGMVDYALLDEVQAALKGAAAKERLWAVALKGSELLLEGFELCKSMPGSLLGLVRGSDLLGVELEEENGTQRRFDLELGRQRSVRIGRPQRLRLENRFGSLSAARVEPPVWASEFGRDGYGLFAAFTVREVEFRLRWIPPGTFLMGSPEDENRRLDSEGPQHLVTISRGFWMQQTPCTQAQWQAVTGENPAEYKGAERPIERVSWHDCRKFERQLSEQVPGLEFALPSEAQWEYACRAGTRSAFNDGSACTEPEGLDPALDTLGWFDENSESETYSVQQKAPNRWGLYDMHGNVWEWCLDGLRTYGDEALSDSLGPMDEDTERAVRGGSCWLSAWRCRSAYRNGFRPEIAGGILGVRFVAGQPEAGGGL